MVCQSECFYRYLANYTSRSHFPQCSCLQPLSQKDTTGKKYSTCSAHNFYHLFSKQYGVIATLRETPGEPKIITLVTSYFPGSNYSRRAASRRSQLAHVTWLKRFQPYPFLAVIYGYRSVRCVGSGFGRVLRSYVRVFSLYFSCV